MGKEMEARTLDFQWQQEKIQPLYHLHLGRRRLLECQRVLRQGYGYR